MIPIFSSYTYSIKPYDIYQFFCQGLSKIKGLHIKLWTLFFKLAVIAQRQRMQTKNPRGKKQGSVTYSSDQENNISTIFNISLWIQIEGKKPNQKNFWILVAMQWNTAC